MSFPHVFLGAGRNIFPVASRGSLEVPAVAKNEPDPVTVLAVCKLAGEMASHRKLIGEKTRPQTGKTKTERSAMSAFANVDPALAQILEEAIRDGWVPEEQKEPKADDGETYEAVSSGLKNEWRSMLARI